jgi:hypothetical protein
MFRCYSPHYFTHSRVNPLPRVTVVGEHKDGVLKLAAAKCSLDDRFVRKVGREMAEKRLKEGKHVLEVKVQKCNSEMFHNYANVVIEDIWSDCALFS